MNELTELYSQYYLPLTKVCFRKGISEDNAHDIVQDTFMTFIEVRKNFQGRSKLSTFLYGICFNKIREFFTRNRRSLDLGKKLKDEMIYVEAHLEDRYKGMVSDPESLAEVREELAEVSSILESIANRDKKVLIANCLFGQNSKEIAASMNINDNHARQLISRAKKKIKSERLSLRSESLMYA